MTLFNDSEDMDKESFEYELTGMISKNNRIIMILFTVFII